METRAARSANPAVPARAAVGVRTYTIAPGEPSLTRLRASFGRLIGFAALADAQAFHGLPTLPGDDDRVDERPRVGAELVRGRRAEARQPHAKTRRPPHGHRE